MPARLVTTPAVHAVLVVLRDGLIWLMLAAVLGIRAARALAEGGAPDAAAASPAATDDAAAGAPRDA